MPSEDQFWLLDENKTPLSASNSSSDWPEPMATQANGLFAKHDRHPGLVLQARVEPVQERATAGDHDARLHDVGRELGRGFVKRDLDGVDDG